MKGRLIGKVRLENGLTLEMFDHSRHVAGDRWLVCFEARVAVEIKPVHFEGDNASGPHFEDILDLLGEKATYRYKKERNFIYEKEKGEVLHEMKKQFMDTNLGYLSSPVFPRMLILRRYKETQSQQPLNP